MATWIKSGDTMIGYQIIPERKKPVFGIMKGNQFVVYGQFHDKESAFNSTMEENLYRIYTLRDMGYDPYVMVYDKPHAPKEIKMLQRWCNNKIIFNSCKRFEDYIQ